MWQGAPYVHCILRLYRQGDGRGRDDGCPALPGTDTGGRGSCARLLATGSGIEAIAGPGDARFAERVVWSRCGAELSCTVDAVASVYPAYVAKAERKGRTRAEVDEIIRWLTGYTQQKLDAHIQKTTTFEAFFAEASDINPLRREIKGVVCGVRVEDVKEPLMQEIRYLDKLIDELAKGKAMEKILRQSAGK